MSFVENKFEFMIAALVLVMMWGASSLFKAGTHGQNLMGADIVYEMPRPKSFNGGEFDLSDREIDRRYINPFEKKKALEAAAKAKGSAETNAKAAAAAKVAQENVKKAEAAKKAKVTARVITKDAKAGFSGSDEMTNTQTQTPPAVAATATVNTPPVADAGAVKKEVDKLSPDQWRALISGQPTQANMAKLLVALRAGDIDEGTFDQIVQDLMLSSNAEKQTLSLYAVKAYPSGGSFKTVVNNEDHLSATLKVEAETFLSSYKTPQQATYLMAAMRSGDLLVVTKAFEVFKLGYAALGTTPITAPIAGTPSTGSASTMSATTYAGLFKATFASLLVSPNQEIKAWASQTINANQIPS